MLVPLIAGVALASARVVTEADSIRAENALDDQVKISIAVEQLVQSLQDERDQVEIYLTNGQQGADMTTLTKAEQQTQASINALHAAEQAGSAGISSLSTAGVQLEGQANARLGDLTSLRSSVTSLGAGRPIYQAYSVIVSSLLNFSGQLGTTTTDHQLANLVSTYGLIEQTGEESSQERGFLVGILGGGGQLAAQEQSMIQAQTQYNSAFTNFLAQAPADVANQYETNVGGNQPGAADNAVQQTIDAAFGSIAVGNINIADTTAFSDMTVKIGQIRAIQQTVGQDMLDRTSTLLKEARTQLYLNIAIIIGVLLLAFIGTIIIARSIVNPLRVLRTTALEIANLRLPGVIQRLRDPNEASQEAEVAPIEVDSRDEVGQVARAFDEVHLSAVRLASEQALLRGNVNAIFTNLSRRSQTLVERQLQMIDSLENVERDAEKLAQLFRLDHLATRMRRNNENLLVLAGEETARKWTESVRLVDVARAAAAEVEQYERIVLGELPRVSILGKAAPDIAHLIAELLENATAFSAPRTKVWIAARPASDGGVIVRIEDAGIGMKRSEMDEANDRIGNPPVVDVSVSRRMGLFVVGRLAARHSVAVRLDEAQTGGVGASIHVPLSLIAPIEDAARRGGSGGGFQDRDQGQGGGGSGFVDDEFSALSRQFSTTYQGGRDGFGPAVREPAARDREREPQPQPQQQFPARGLDLDSSSSSLAVRPDPYGDRPALGPWHEPRPAPAQQRPTGFGGRPVFSGPNAPSPDDSGESWFSASEGRVERRPPRPRPGALPSDEPEPRQAAAPPAARAGGPVPYHPLGQRFAQMTADGQEERLPIFEAIESEWFRRRRAAHADQPGWDAQAESQTAHIGIGNGNGERPVPAAPAPAAMPVLPPPAGEPLTTAIPAPRQPAVPREPVPVVEWSSPGDEGWKAAESLATPAQAGMTQSGLPKRQPKANLVPGRAGGTGAARATPSIPGAVDEMGRRLSTFRRNEPPEGGAR
ncbi:MAG TPA: nitrate- and nitrite sensing domain-containing protein [Actinocrinis sp.]